MPELNDNRVKNQLAVQRNAALDNLSVSQALAEQLNEYLTIAFTHLSRLADDRQEVLNAKLEVVSEDVRKKYSPEEKNDYENKRKSEQLLLESSVPGYKEWKNGTNRVPG